MTSRKKTLLAAFAAGLALPVAGFAEVIDLPAKSTGVTVTTTPTTPTVPAACPTNCVVVAKVTGYQSKVGDVADPMKVPKSGRIVAWTLTLGKPDKKQITFFETDSGLGAPEAHFTVLKPDKKGLISQVVAHGPPTAIGGYFGKTVQFPLEKSIPVKRGNLIALTSNSWAPVMAVNQANTTIWRASRPKAKCSDTQGRDYSQTKPKQRTKYACLYRGVQLLYSVTIVTDAPKPSKTGASTTITTPTTTPTTTTAQP